MGRSLWRSVRFRTTAVAVGTVAIVLASSAVALVVLLRVRLADDVRASAELRARDVAALVDEGNPPSRLSLTEGDDDVIQVHDETGGLIASSENMRGEPAIAPPPPGEARRVAVPVDDDPYLAVTISADGGRTVVVARSLESVEESTAALTQLLALGAPLLLAVVGVIVWKLTGVALRPVDAMREEVDAIGASALHQRVPDPGGTDEIARLAATMNAMLERLERSQHRQRAFVSDASHELRSPVATIRQHAEVARAHPDRTTPDALAAAVLREVTRLQALIDNLLVLARADEGASRRLEPVDVDDIVFDEARRLRDTTDLAVSTADVTAGRIDGDPLAVRTIVRNLADNAARHAMGHVDFALGVQDGTVVLRVDDDGPGIPSEHRDRVLERFVRLDDARGRDSGGSGLGLAIVDDLVTAHRGTIAITTSSRAGTSVEVTFSADSASE